MSHSPPPTVLERIVAQARTRPDSVALRRCDGRDAMSYGELIGAVEDLAAALEADSVTHGSRVVVLSDNGPQTYLSVLACARLGAIAVMVDDSLPAATISRFCEIARPAAIIPNKGGGVGAENGEIAYPKAQPDSSANEALAMIFTSGTTGEPKAVLLPNRTFFAIPDILRTEGLRWIDWVAGETTYSPLPATHIGGLWWILNGLMHGASCITGGEQGASLRELLVDNEVATACLVPTLLTRLVSELKLTGTDVPALRFIAYGGSRAIAADVRFIEAAGVRTAQVYGLSETGCTALCLPTDSESISRIEQGAVGRPYPGVQTYLSPEGGGGPTTGAESASYGTLWIKSPANMLEYWGSPERTGEVLAEGWVNTGDLVERRADGFFYIRGRSSEMIISGGVNVVPDEVDRIAEDIAGVREAACYEIPDEEFGALVGLAVVPATELDGPGTAALKQRIAATYRRESESMARPSTIVLVEDIPRTTSGKVMRSALSASLNGARARV
ncbi:fatty acid--CoA ligase FadD10 [Mycobacteroides abscessus subsp. massiliense]|uniref:Acyl-CoA synthetase n=1 Tax=Mycobacteroides abscessus subsp. bolletii 50594 TaxID=1303024 RepID=A0AB33A666_9MYCO|nr:fatty acid--CoA ligase FadD10 [Mycobacteroides abscessus]AGM27234.1 acyl-CoA synthetase [Mycobacteroides abscessus subsp. bolletii 50594]MDO3299534.1 fatty acid--CoA ligase FadD10 [Mycobacteroides abscessus subsp. massiliense]BBZ82853.1 putative long chain fatty acid-coA ligase [Mycobacteroides abscessus]SLG40244.1 long-chain-fatty-acid--CoA ligase [Mycobacteroides abscessus subsp. massiliense]